MAARQTQVLICGAGPTGLALAVELGLRGIECIIVERHSRVGRAPRAKTTHTRTREHLRRWGIADDLAALSPFGVDFPSNVHFVTRLSGYKLATIEDAFNCAPARNELYAEHAQWVPQYLVEEVLRKRVVSLPNVELRLEHDFVSADQTDAGVHCRVRDLKSDVELTIKCDYLVGADGPRSSIRDLIGATMEGRYGLAYSSNIVFRAPGLSERHAHGPGIMYWQINSEVPSLIGPMDRDDLWYFMPARAPNSERLDTAAAAELIRRATGIDAPYEVLSADEWAASEFIADKYGDGRIFLVGDACHLHPPTGGYGMNMGIGDAVDLGWKIAAVLQGWGGPYLLDSYGLERRPAERRVIDAALSNYATLTLHDAMSPMLESDSPEGEALRKQVGDMLAKGREQEFRSLGVMLGVDYLNSPIVALEDGVVEQDPAMREYFPAARPGARAPHAWLDGDRSLFDLFGEGFTLIAFNASVRDDVERAVADADALHIPLKVLQIEDGRIASLYERSLALIRPDQHVAWRGDTWPGKSVLARATGRLVSNGSETAEPVKSAAVR